MVSMPVPNSTHRKYLEESHFYFEYTLFHHKSNNEIGMQQNPY